MMWLGAKEQRFVFSKGFKSTAFPTETLPHKITHVTCTLRIDHRIRYIGNSHSCLLNAYRQFNILRNILCTIPSESLKHLCSEGTCCPSNNVDCVKKGVTLLEIERKEIFQMLYGTYKGLGVSYLYIANCRHNTRICECPNEISYRMPVYDAVCINRHHYITMSKFNSAVESAALPSILLIIVDEVDTIEKAMCLSFILRDKASHHLIGPIRTPIVYHNN